METITIGNAYLAPIYRVKDCVIIITLAYYHNGSKDGRALIYVNRSLHRDLILNRALFKYWFHIITRAPTTSSPIFYEHLSKLKKVTQRLMLNLSEI